MPRSTHPLPQPAHTRRDTSAARVACGFVRHLLVACFAFAAATVPSRAGAGSDTAGAQHEAAVRPPAGNNFGQHLQPSARRAANAKTTRYTPIRADDGDLEIEEIEMFVGESRVLPAPGVARIAVGNGQIMSAAALDEQEVIVFANAVGTSSLFVWNGDGRYQRVKISIVPGDTPRIAREIAAFLGAIPNAKTSVIGDKVIVEGDELSDADLAKIDELAKRYPQIVNFTDRIGWEQMVLMDVKVVEFPVSELRELGLKWQATGGTALGAIWRPVRAGHDGPFQIDVRTGQNNAPPITNQDGTASVRLPGTLNVIGAVNIGLNAQLNLLAQDGKASVLAEPQLSTRNGARASFLAGGEFPYSVSTINGVTVIFKPYGVKLDVLPRVDRTGAIRASIEAEVSSLDPSVSTPSGPALLTRKTATEFNVHSGETIVLSGLLQRDASTSVDKLPLLGDLPVLGALFRSTRYQNKETELVVFVTPTVVDGRTAGLAERVERATRRLEREYGKPPYLPDPLHPAPADAAHGRISGALPEMRQAWSAEAPRMHLGAARSPLWCLPGQDAEDGSPARHAGGAIARLGRE